MNFNALSSNEKLAVYGAAAAIVGIIIGSFVSGLGWLVLLAGVAMLVIVFLPQFSAGTELPGSKGSLMLITGAVAGVAALLAILTIIGDLGVYFQIFPLQTIFLLIAVVGGLVMAWAGWQEFQSEGGTFRVGTSGGGASQRGTSAGGAGSGTTIGSSTGSTTGTTTATGTTGATGTTATTGTTSDASGMGGAGSAGTGSGASASTTTGSATESSAMGGSTGGGSTGGETTRDDEGGYRNP